jgi:PAS domain S-box-containing protein
MLDETEVTATKAFAPRGAAGVVVLAAFAAVIFGLCVVSIEMPRDLGRAAPFWPSNALVLGALLIAPRRTWLGWLAAAGLGNFTADLLTAYGPGLSSLLTACNLAEVALTAFLLRRIVGPRLDVGRVGDLIRLLLVGGLFSPLICATAAAALLGRLTGPDSLFNLLSWAAADGLGVMVVAPLLLGLRDASRQLALTPLRPAGWLKLGVVAAAALVSFSVRQPLFFLIPAAMLLAVFELEVLGAALSVLIVVAMGIAASMIGHAPMTELNLSLPDRLIVGQVFLAAITLTSFPTAAVLSQRRQLKAKLDEQYRRVKLAEEVAGVGYWRLDLATRKVEWSDMLFEATGLPRDSAPSADCALDAVYPADRPALEAMLARALSEEGDQSLNYRVVRPNGQIRHVIAKASRELGPDGKPAALFGTMLDVTEVSEREARYRMLADAATDIVLKVDAGDVICYASPSVRRYGYEPEALVGRTGFSLVHPEDLAKVQSLIAGLFSGDEVDETVDRTYRVRTADGGWIWVEGNPAIIRDDDRTPIAVVSQIRDITARKAMEDELRAARQAAEAAAQVKAEFLANMSHELRTPLTSVIGFTRLALDQGGLSETARGYVAKASNAGAALLATVNDILDFSKLESGQLQIRPEPCDVGEVCRETLELFSADAGAKGVALRYDAKGLPPAVRLDPTRLRQILLNLIGNAVKFSERGEVRLTAAWKAGRLQVSVKDDGPGIAADQQQLLFRRFSQVDGSATRRHGGSGLGLAICLGLAEAMGGSIGVESKPGKGARFFFELPAERCDVEAVGEAQALATVPPGARVLVADDHAFNRELVRAVLAPFGAEVTEAADGAEVVAAAAREAFDIILMDLRMPSIEGLEAMKAIRAGKGPNRTTPILAFSAGADAPGAEARRRAGFDGDLPKPLLPADLIAAIARYAPPAAEAAAKPKRRRAARKA